MKWQGRRQSTNVIDARSMKGKLFQSSFSKQRPDTQPLTRAELAKKPRLQKKKGPRVK